MRAEETDTINISDTLITHHDLLQHAVRENIEVLITHTEPNAHTRINTAQLQRVLINLTMQAQQAMPHGGIISISTDIACIDTNSAAQNSGVEPGSYAVLSIRYSGEDIDQESFDCLFEPYLTKQPGFSGSGLALATVHAIASRHNGYVRVKSIPEEGYTLFVYFPQATSTEIEDKTTLVERHGPRGTETVVVVEDELIVREFLVRILRDHGYQVFEAAGPHECLKLFRELKIPIDMLVTDVVMPQMSGQELYTQIAGTYPEMKVLFVSGYTDSVIARHGMFEQGVHLLQKPFSLLRLTSKVRAVLDA